MCMCVYLFVYTGCQNSDAIQLWIKEYGELTDCLHTEYIT